MLLRDPTGISPLKVSGKNISKPIIGDIKICCINPVCGHDNNEHFLKGLYVISAPISSSSMRVNDDNTYSPSAEFDKEVKFSLWKTNDDGVLYQFPLEDSKEDCITSKVACLSQLTFYGFYFIEHFDPKFARECIKMLNDEKVSATAIFGEPLIKMPKLEKSAKNEAESQYRINITNDKHFISCKEKVASEIESRGIKVGHKNYGYQILFENMPTKDCHWTKKKVITLEAHLGFLRYPIGSSTNPYSPHNTGNDFGKKLYNGVLSFCSDAKKQAGKKVKNHKELLHKIFEYDSLTLKKECRDPNDWSSSKHPSMLPSFTHKFKGPPEGSIPSVEIPNFDSVNSENYTFVFVDKKIGDAIETWAFNGIIKSGHILVSRELNFQNGDISPRWYRDDFEAAFGKWDDAIKALGAKEGVITRWTFRDIYTGMKHLTPGMVNKSLHKTGLAADLYIHTHVKVFNHYPLNYEREDALGMTDRDAFRVFLRINKETDANTVKKLKELKQLIDQRRKKSAGYKWLKKHYDKSKYQEFIKYKVTQWKYDGFTKKGGEKNTTLKRDQGFADLTLSAEAFGINRINAHQKGWQIINKKKKINVRYSKHFSMISRHLNHAQSMGHGDYECKIIPNHIDISGFLQKETKAADKIYKRCSICNQRIKKDQLYRASDSKATHLSCIYEYERFNKYSETTNVDTNVESLKPSNLKLWNKSFKIFKPKPRIDTSLPNFIKKINQIQRAAKNPNPPKKIRSWQLTKSEANSTLDIEADIFLRLGAFTNNMKNIAVKDISDLKPNSLGEFSDINYVAVRPIFSQRAENAIQKNKKSISYSKYDKKILKYWQQEWLKANPSATKGKKIILASSFNGFIDKFQRINKKSSIKINLACYLLPRNDCKNKDQFPSNHVTPIFLHKKRYMPKQFINQYYAWRRSREKSLLKQLFNNSHVYINPHLVDAENYKCLPLSYSFYYPHAGKPGHMEWWHYQYNEGRYKDDGKSRKKWHELMEDIGWTKEGLKYIGYKIP